MKTPSSVVKTVLPIAAPRDKEPLEVWVENPSQCKIPTHLQGLSLAIKQQNLECFGRDESGGKPMPIAAVLLPKTEYQLGEILKRFSSHRKPLTIGSAHTGLSRGAVPEQPNQEILSMRHFVPFAPQIHKEKDSKVTAVVSAGTRLMDFQDFVEANDFYYPPDPTERTALMGGTVATNASGPRTLRYGPTRNWVRSLRVMLAHGEILALRRGEVLASEGLFAIQRLDQSVCNIPVPTYSMPEVKNAAGYFSKPGMDLIDLFIGSEGTLGIITQIEVALIARPAHRYSANIYFASEQNAMAFATAARALSPSLLEYFDSASVAIMRERFQQIGSTAKAAIYFEQEMDALSPSIIEKWHALALTHRALEIQEAQNNAQRESLRAMRHSVPEEVNRRIAYAARKYPDVGITKVASDIAVPETHFSAMMAYYKEILDKTDMAYAIWGHIGNNHVHVNMIPQTPAQHETAKNILLEFARKAKALGGTITAEHGTGKIKVPQLKLLYDRAALRQMAAIKKALDPACILSPGNLLGPDQDFTPPS